MGLYALAGILSGEKIVAGCLGAMWAYLTVVGAYELNRRKFNWVRGSHRSDPHLFAGTLAASTGLIISGALDETMPMLAIVPALSAIMQANDGHEKKYRSLIHAAVLLVGVVIGIWFYSDGVIGKVLLERIEALP
jgi:hypothetical protein